jgi:hypothetical protein
VGCRRNIGSRSILTLTLPKLGKVLTDTDRPAPAPAPTTLLLCRHPLGVAHSQQLETDAIRVDFFRITLCRYELLSNLTVTVNHPSVKKGMKVTLATGGKVTELTGHERYLISNMILVDFDQISPESL